MAKHPLDAAVTLPLPAEGLLDAPVHWGVDGNLKMTVLQKRGFSLKRALRGELVWSIP